MKCLVPIKRVIDYAVKVRVKADKTGVELANVKMSMNPFCEIAVEEAVRLKAKGIVSEIIAVSVGPKSVHEVLRTSMAMGADRAIHINTGDSTRTDLDLQPLAVSKLLMKIVQKESPQLVIMGKQAIDGDNGQTGQMLAGLLSWSQATNASELKFAEDKKTVDVTREVDGGLQTLQLILPCVLTCDLRLNEPRFATLPNIMKAKKKPLDVIEGDSLGVEIKPRLRIVSVNEPSQRQAGALVESIDDLVGKLKKSGVV